ncbi:MAG: HsdR family type I site-specific deoxyribonuclease [Acidimicrobiaceae bacterium]|nr:HsdR family type I site-specific deoxyribonuclease [Acidimicrobiaceae bacterium]MYJ80355.1 HsdR family type I site-specific deoxyribonuclease [Acidimicrobiaceae bacterium]MYK73837.1 HsdR family type I site-specific deoxyribonuclease [Acidimicrobiaceae bacterium]
MAKHNIAEAETVQFPMVLHAAEVGWTPLAPRDAFFMRGGEAGLLLRGEAEKALRRFNPWMTDDAVRSVVENLQALPPTIEGNRQMLAWLRGERQWHDEVEQRHRRVRLVNFDDPSANVLHVTWEWRLKPPTRKGNRADVMFIVNGVPVAIVEHKNPKDADAIERGVTQLRRYEAETPELMGAAQLFNVTHLLDYWYGVTWNLSRRYMVRWKETREESYRFAVQSFFEPTDFMRTLRDWILFYVEDGELRKTVLRQHQRRAVNRIVERCAEPTRHRGLVWHTQGAGKTFTLLTAARLILERKDELGAPTVIVVVDRRELEGQLEGWVERLLGELQQQDIPVWRAGSKEELQDLLRNDRRGLIVSMIHKFESIEKDANRRKNIYVFIDEAHRSVARELGTYLMAALPNSTIIGFTGTPVARTPRGQGTFKIFGADDDQGYLDKYSIAESIEDETTLPIRHMMAPSEMTVPAEQLDTEFLALAEAEGLTDVDELNQVLDRAVGLRTFLTADERIEKVAAFVAEHLRENVLPLGYKAFLVAVNREACAKYKRALDRLLPLEWTTPVYSDNPNDVVERPLVAELQLSDEQEKDVRLSFKQANEDPKLLIVTDKLLTGFDAPLLYCLYLDKPMRDHVLLQAIARVNRPFVDSDGLSKPIGLVVDFVGVLRELNKALQFDSSDVGGAIEDLDLLMQDFQDRIDRAKAKYLNHEERGRAAPGEGHAASAQSADALLEHVVYTRFLDPDVRKLFFSDYKQIEELWEVLSPSAELRDHIDTFTRLTELYVVVRNAYADRPDFVAELAHKTRRLVEGSAEMRGLGSLTKTVTFDPRTLAALRRESGPEEAKVFSLVRGLRVDVDAKPAQGPVLRPILERAEQVLQGLEERTITGLGAMDLLEALAGEKEAAANAAEDSPVGDRAFGVYWKLKDDVALEVAGVSAMKFAEEAQALMNRFPNAAVNADEQRRLRTSLYNPLLPVDSDERSRIVEQAVALLLGEDATANA